MALRSGRPSSVVLQAAVAHLARHVGRAFVAAPFQLAFGTHTLTGCRRWLVLQLQRGQYLGLANLQSRFLLVPRPESDEHVGTILGRLAAGGATHVKKNLIQKAPPIFEFLSLADVS